MGPGSNTNATGPDSNTNATGPDSNTNATGPEVRRGRIYSTPRCNGGNNTTSTMGPDSSTCVLLMVSGGSDSMAMLELAALAASGDAPQGPVGAKLARMFAASLPQDSEPSFLVLHVNHLLRGKASDGDEEFVVRRCQELGVPFRVRRVDVAALAKRSGHGMEAVARGERYRLAAEVLATATQSGDGFIFTAHTLDDRVETFLMRSLVGTGPGGLASIPRRRGNIVRPLLDATREELRTFLAEQHPAASSTTELWRDDATNDDGSNFRSQVRGELVPVMRKLKPGFEASLARTMDLIAEEDDARSQAAQGIVYRNLTYDDAGASLPLKALDGIDVPLKRRVIRQCLLVVNPDARLEAAQIQRVIDGIASGQPFAVDVDSSIRVNGDAQTLRMRVVR